VDGGRFDCEESVESGLIGMEGGISCTAEPWSDVVVEGAGEFDKEGTTDSFILVVLDSPLPSTRPVSAGVEGRDEDNECNFRSQTTLVVLGRLSFVDDDPVFTTFRGGRTGPVRRVCLGGTNMELDIVFGLDPTEEGTVPEPF